MLLPRGSNFSINVCLLMTGVCKYDELAQIEFERR